MSPDNALQLLASAAAEAHMSMADHEKCVMARQVLQNVLHPPADPPRPPKDPSKQPKKPEDPKE